MYYISTLSLSPSKTTQRFVCIIVDWVHSASIDFCTCIQCATCNLHSQETEHGSQYKLKNIWSTLCLLHEVHVLENKSLLAPQCSTLIHVHFSNTVNILRHETAMCIYMVHAQRHGWPENWSFLHASWVPPTCSQWDEVQMHSLHWFSTVNIKHHPHLCTQYQSNTCTCTRTS